MENKNNSSIRHYLSRILFRSGKMSFDEEEAHHNSSKFDPRIKWIDSWLGPQIQGKKVADVGCWLGLLLKWATVSGAIDITGFDLAGPWINIAKSRLGDSQVIPISSILNISPVYNNTFDLVFCLETIEHVPRGEEILTIKKISDLLKPGGQIVISTPIAGFAALTDPAWWLMGHRHYRQKTLESLVLKAGLHIEETVFSGNLWTSAAGMAYYIKKHIFKSTFPWSPSLISKADTDLSPINNHLAWNIWIRARK